MPTKQYEVWHKNDDHSGYPVLVTTDKDAVEKLCATGDYEVHEYMAYPVI